MTEMEPELDEKPFDLKTWPFYWVVQAHGSYLSALEAELKSENLDIPRWRVLMLLDEGRACSISYLAREARTKLSTMTRIVQRMEGEGVLVTRSAVKDARVTEALLTVKGGAAREVAWKKAHRVYARAFDNISEREVFQLVSTLEQLSSNLQNLVLEKTD